jgi:hypothetical protein
MLSTLTTMIVIDDREPLPGELAIEQETISVLSNTATKPDPGWEHTDVLGHFHAFAADGKLPTLNVEAVEMPCNGACGSEGGCEGYTSDRYTCKICGQEIEPHWIPDHTARTTGVQVPGRKSATVTVESPTLLGDRRDKVTIRVLSEDQEWIGVGEILGHNGTFSSGETSFRITIAAHSLEPRLRG